MLGNGVEWMSNRGSGERASWNEKNRHVLKIGCGTCGWPFNLLQIENNDVRSFRCTVWLSKNNSRNDKFGIECNYIHWTQFSFDKWRVFVDIVKSPYIFIFYILPISNINILFLEKYPSYLFCLNIKINEAFEKSIARSTY